MRTAIEKAVTFSATPETPREREIFTVIAISSAGVELRLAEAATRGETGTLFLRDSMACAVLANLAQVAHRRMQEIELAALGSAPQEGAADGSADAAAPAVGASHPAPA